MERPGLPLCGTRRKRVCHLSRGSSHRGSSGSSYSETPASMGVPLEESREGLTSITPEFMEELESADTCNGRAKGQWVTFRKHLGQGHAWFR